jgi:hypothetical protein
MNIRKTILALLACLMATVAAVRALDDLSSWVVDQMGTEGRAAFALANAPWFEARDATAAPAALPTTGKQQDARSR